MARPRKEEESRWREQQGGGGDQEEAKDKGVADTKAAKPKECLFCRNYAVNPIGEGRWAGFLMCKVHNPAHGGCPPFDLWMPTNVV